MQFLAVLARYLIGAYSVSMFFVAFMFAVPEPFRMIGLTELLPDFVVIGLFVALLPSWVATYTVPMLFRERVRFTKRARLPISEKRPLLGIVPVAVFVFTLINATLRSSYDMEPVAWVMVLTGSASLWPTSWFFLFVLRSDWRTEEEKEMGHPALHFA